LFQNLLSNGIKYCNNKQPCIQISHEPCEDHHWMFSIKDNGIGIESKYQKYIFKLFKRLHQPDEFSGSGIGLVICEKIVNRHQGKIRFTSVPGKGTIFLFYFVEEYGK